MFKRAKGLSCPKSVLNTNMNYAQKSKEVVVSQRCVEYKHKLCSTEQRGCCVLKVC
jgi:hypothetical protein